MRPADAHRVTVFGSTLNISATSPGVNNRSEISMVTCHLHNRAPTGLVRRAGVCPLCDIRSGPLRFDRPEHPKRMYGFSELHTLCPDSTLTLGLVASGRTRISLLRRHVPPFGPLNRLIGTNRLRRSSGARMGPRRRYVRTRKPRRLKV